MSDLKLVYQEGSEYFNASSCFAYGVLTEAKVITSNQPSLKQCKPNDSSKKKLTQEQFDYVMGQQSFYRGCTPQNDEANRKERCEDFIARESKLMEKKQIALSPFIRPNENIDWYSTQIINLMSKYTDRLKQKASSDKKTKAQ